MTAVTKLRMNADEFIAWAMNQPKGKRYELAGGEVVAISPERAGHSRAKYRVWMGLRDALRNSALACEVFGDGPSVRIDNATVYEPDALVRCGPLIDDDKVEIDDPIVIVEVMSPSTQALDAVTKLEAYFRIPTVRHYLIVNLKNLSVIHHARAEDGRVETRVIRSGGIVLDPPGITFEAARFFED
jgi:Uma2 family endonuclease